MLQAPYVWVTPDALTIGAANQEPGRALLNGILNFYSSPVGTAGFGRFVDSWRDRGAEACRNNAFDAASTPQIWEPPFDVIARNDGMEPARRGAQGMVVLLDAAVADVDARHAAVTVAAGHRELTFASQRPHIDRQ